MHKSATKCNKTLSIWCKNKHGASKIIDTFETYQLIRTRSLGINQGKGQRVQKFPNVQEEIQALLMCVLRR
jgi:hypothetical protein